MTERKWVITHLNATILHLMVIVIQLAITARFAAIRAMLIGEQNLTRFLFTGSRTMSGDPNLYDAVAYSKTSNAVWVYYKSLKQWFLCYSSTATMLRLERAYRLYNCDNCI